MRTATFFDGGVHMIRKAADWIDRLRGERPLVIGVQGLQGSGKTTLCAQLETTVQGCVSVSLDDFYLPDDAIDQTHDDPRLRGRGNPGTHDLRLLHDCVDRVKRRRPVSFPVYDKNANGGRGDRSRETRHAEEVDVLILEGWCLGFRPCHNGDLVDAHLKAYQPIFDAFDAMIILEADLANLRPWRTQAEATMTFDETRAFIDRFIPTYETYLRDFIADPGRVAIIFALDSSRNVVSCTQLAKKERRSLGATT